MLGRVREGESLLDVAHFHWKLLEELDSGRIRLRKNETPEELDSGRIRLRKNLILESGEANGKGLLR